MAVLRRVGTPCSATASRWPSVSASPIAASNCRVSSFARQAALVRQSISPARAPGAGVSGLTPAASRSLRSAFFRLRLFPRRFAAGIRLFETGGKCRIFGDDSRACCCPRISGGTSPGEPERRERIAREGARASAMQDSGRPEKRVRVRVCAGYGYKIDEAAGDGAKQQFGM
jgi:hypothetical protein